MLLFDALSYSLRSAQKLIAIEDFADFLEPFPFSFRQADTTATQSRTKRPRTTQAKTLYR
jgi:hypothetical protein